VKIIGLSSIYKNNYSTGEGGTMTIDDGANLPLKVIKTSFCGSSLDTLMKNSRVSLDN